MNRPLLCVAIAFVLGEAFECQRIHPLIGLLSILVITGIIAKYTDDIRKRRGIIRWIFISSLFFVMGYFNLSEKESQIFVPNDQESVMLQGDIYKLEEKNKGAYLYIENVAIDELQHSRKILAYVPDEVEEDASECFFKGDRIAVSGKLSAFAQASNPGAFDEALYYRSLNLDGKMYVDTVSCLYQGPLWKRWIGALRNDLVSIYKACLPKDYGVVSAMVLGEKSALDPEIKKYYQRCGIAHILAISGLHVAMIGMALYQILRKMGIRIGISAVCAFCFIWLYGFFTDFGISTKRAVCMFILGILAKVLGRTYDLLTAAAISLMILLIEMPMLIYNSGVWFSFFAVAGIELIMPALAMLINSKKVSQIAGASLSVTLMTLPLSAWFSFEIPVYSVFLNLIVVPLMSSVVFLVVLGGLAGSFNLLSGRFLMGMVHYILVFYTWLCQMNLKLPGAVAVVGRPPLWAVFLYYGSLAVFIYIGRKGIQKAWIALIAIMFIFVRPPKTGLLVSALDVGQGDGNIITYHGCTYMIDGGSTSQKNVASYQIVPYLKYQGIAAVDYVFLSHGDEDHIGGVKEMIESQDLLGIEIGHLVITDITHEAAGGIEEIAESAKAAGIDIIRMAGGDVLHHDEMSLTCLGPEKGSEMGSENAASMVLSLEFESFSMLFTGDLEGKGEEKLCSEPLTCYDVLKVAHHGSKNATSAGFLKKVQPSVALISCGAHNRYGHPAKETLKRLDEVNADIWCTKDSGAIFIETDGQESRLWSYCNQEEND